MSNLRTTLTGIVTAAAYLVGVWGFEVDPAVQDSIVVLGLFLIGLFARDAKKDGEAK